MTQNHQAILGESLFLYGSDQFLRSAAAAGVTGFRLNSPDVHAVVRMALASDTIPNLGGVALLEPTELTNTRSTEVATPGHSSPSAQLQEQIMLNELTDGSVRGRNSLSQVLLGHIQEDRSLLYFGTEPDEQKIVAGLYDTAALAEAKNDQWFSGAIKDAGVALPGLLGGNVGRFLGNALVQFGQGIPEMRKAHDRQLLTSKRPVILAH